MCCPRIRQHTRPVQRGLSINAWAGIVGYHIVVPYMLRQNLTGSNYLNFSKYCPPVERRTRIRRHAFFRMVSAFKGGGERPLQHCRASPPECNLGQQWIRQGGPVHWLALSDLYCLDFLLFFGGGELRQETDVGNQLRDEKLVSIRIVAGNVPDTPRVLENIRSPCTEDAKPALRPGVATSNTFDDDRCLFNLLLY